MKRDAKGRFVSERGHLTLADWAKTLEPEGPTADVVDLLSQSNQMMEDTARMPQRPFLILPRIKRAPCGVGWYLRWGRRLWLCQTIMGFRL